MTMRKSKQLAHDRHIGGLKDHIMKAMYKTKSHVNRKELTPITCQNSLQLNDTTSHPTPATSPTPLHYNAPLSSLPPHHSPVHHPSNPPTPTSSHPPHLSLTSTRRPSPRRTSSPSRRQTQFLPLPVHFPDRDGLFRLDGQAERRDHAAPEEPADFAGGGLSE